MDMIDCVRGSPDDTSAHSEMSIDCRPEVRDNHTLVVTSNDPQGTTINRRKNDKCRLDIRDDDMCGIMNKLAFANFHDVSVKCDRTAQRESCNDLRCVTPNENGDDSILSVDHSMLIPEVQIQTESAVFLPRPEIKPKSRVPVFLPRSVDPFKRPVNYAPRINSFDNLKNWRGRFLKPKFLFSMPDEEKLQREENLRRKREAERLRYNKIKTDPQLSASQTLKEKEKYLRKKEAKQIKLIKDMTDFEHQMKKQQWRYNSSAYYKRKKSKRAGDSGVEMMRKNEKLESCIERLKSRSIRLFIPANQMVT